MLKQDLFVFHNLKQEKQVIYAKLLVLHIFSSVGNNQKSVNKFTNIFLMQVVDH